MGRSSAGPAPMTAPRGPSRWTGRRTPTRSTWSCPTDPRGRALIGLARAAGLDALGLAALLAKVRRLDRRVLLLRRHGWKDRPRFRPIRRPRWTRSAR